jgi:hypothetical protein
LPSSFSGLLEFRLEEVSGAEKHLVGRLATTMIVPIRRAAKDVIEMLLAHYAKAVEHFMLQSLNHSFDVRL